jgi:hypothetical protein
MKTPTEEVEKKVSARKIEANQQNSKKSTGPRTAAGKAHSARNALKHGLLARKLLFQDGTGEGSRNEFAEFLEKLRHDLQPVGAFEEFLVEKIATDGWKMQFVLQHETRAIGDGYAFLLHSDSRLSLDATEELFRNDYNFDKIVRYGTANDRDFFRTFSALERAQRSRRRDKLPAPMIDSTGERPFCETKPTSSFESAEAQEPPASPKEEGGTSPSPTAGAHEEQGSYGNSQRRLDTIKVAESTQKPK